MECSNIVDALATSSFCNTAEMKTNVIEEGSQKCNKSFGESSLPVIGEEDEELIVAITSRQPIASARTERNWESRSPSHEPAGLMVSSSPTPSPPPRPPSTSPSPSPLSPDSIRSTSPDSLASPDPGDPAAILPSPSSSSQASTASHERATPQTQRSASSMSKSSGEYAQSPRHTVELEHSVSDMSGTRYHVDFSASQMSRIGVKRSMSQLSQASGPQSIRAASSLSDISEAVSSTSRKSELSLASQKSSNSSIDASSTAEQKRDYSSPHQESRRSSLSSFHTKSPNGSPKKQGSLSPTASPTGSLTETESQLTDINVHQSGSKIESQYSPIESPNGSPTKDGSRSPKLSPTGSLTQTESQLTDINMRQTESKIESQYSSIESPSGSPTKGGSVSRTGSLTQTESQMTDIDVHETGSKIQSQYPPRSPVSDSSLSGSVTQTKSQITDVGELPQMDFKVDTQLKSPVRSPIASSSNYSVTQTESRMTELTLRQTDSKFDSGLDSRTGSVKSASPIPHSTSQSSLLDGRSTSLINNELVQRTELSPSHKDPPGDGPFNHSPQMPSDGRAMGTPPQSVTPQQGLSPLTMGESDDMPPAEGSRRPSELPPTGNSPPPIQEESTGSLTAAQPPPLHSPQILADLPSETSGDSLNATCEEEQTELLPVKSAWSPSSADFEMPSETLPRPTLQQSISKQSKTSALQSAKSQASQAESRKSLKSLERVSQFESRTPSQKSKPSQQTSKPVSKTASEKSAENSRKKKYFAEARHKSLSDVKPLHAYPPPKPLKPVIVSQCKRPPKPEFRQIKLFYGINIALSESIVARKNGFRSNESMSETLIKLGATPVPHIGTYLAQQTILVCSLKDFMRKSVKYRDALANKVPIVKERYVEDCIASERLLELEPYLLEGSPLTRPNTTST